MPAAERRRHVVEVAADLFYRRGVHEVGMDELIAATGLAKATVYRLFATKTILIEAYLSDRAAMIFRHIDADVARHPGDPAAAIIAILDAVRRDVSRDDFRGCPFNNASIEFPDPAHPARKVARSYRQGLRTRLQALGTELHPGPVGHRLGDDIALVIEGMYVSAAHLGPDGPAARGQVMVDNLLAAARMNP